MFSISRISLLLCLLIITVGCQKGSEPSSENQTPPPADKNSQSKTVSTETDTKPEEKADEKPKPPELPKNVQGNWVLLLPQRDKMMPLYLFKFNVPETEKIENDNPDTKKTDKKPELQAVELLAKGKEVLPAKIISSKVTEQSVEFEESLLNEGKEVIRLNFQGKLKLDQGVIFGNISFGNESCLPVILLPSIETDFSKITGPIPSPGAQELMQAMQSPDPFKQLNDYTEKLKTAPLALDAFPTLMALALSQNKDKKTIEDLINRYIETAGLWGKRQKVNSLVSIGSMLAKSDSDSSLAPEYLDQADQLIKDGVKPLSNWKSVITLARARAGLKSKNPDQIQVAGKLLQEEFKRTPYDREILEELAKFEKSHGSIDRAIDHYGVLAGSPLSGRERQLIAASKQNPDMVKYENPRDTLKALWKKKNGSTEGLDDYLTKSFKRFLQSFVSKEAKNVDLKKGNRVSLIELFTGASCPPCVAADLATGVIEASFPQSKVIVLRYHQHIPGPDPLTNTDSESRFILYNHRGTPSTNLNGQVIPQVAGGVGQVNSSYQTILEALIPELSKNTDVKIDLSASVKDGTLELKANATGTEKIEEKLRLVAVLAEDELQFQAPNGINFHDMIVRSMLSEPNGFQAVDGKLTLTKSLPLDEFKNRLTDYLSAFEEKSGANFTGAPLALDKLHFVVFVQGELSRDIFQVASVPVSGTIAYRTEQPESKPKENEKPANATKPDLKAKPANEKPAKTEAKSKTKPEEKKEKK